MIFYEFLAKFSHFYSMETSDIIAVFFAQEEAPMALLFGPESIVPGRVALSCLGSTFDRVKVVEALVENCFK